MLQQKVLKADTTLKTVTATCDELGNINGDGSVDISDAISLMNYIAGKKTLTNSQLVCADVDGDGIVTDNDTDLVMSYIATNISTFPAGDAKSTRTASVMQNNQWYDYNNKAWANAILVSDTNRSTYQNASAGTEITQSDILAYYVWIPRYKYKVWNKDKVIGTDSYNARTTGIDIVFENEKTSTGTISCTYSYATASSTAGSPNETCTGSNGDYYTHPAFTFGSDEVRGFWIGKYEVSSSDPSASNGGGESTSLTVRVLPNVTSWRGNYLSDQSTVIQNMQTSSNIYGLNTSRTVVDSHMLTNYEWGAVAYLTNSNYGRCTNGSCTEVTINNCSSQITGIGADSVSDGSSSTTCTTAANKYNGAKGVLASTTGNVYGVYDMSGGADEYVMGNMSSASGSYTFYPRSGGFASDWYNASTAKYLTTYAYESSYSNSTNQTAYNRGRLGDATGEVVLSAGESGGWYGNNVSFLYSNSDWFTRGGSYCSSGPGPFVFHYFSGIMLYSYSSRAALIGLS